MKGETVTVKTFGKEGTDPFGAPIKSEATKTVENVLVQPGACSDVEASNRPDGVSVKYTLHFPKTFDQDLEGAEVEVRGIWLKVIGRPDHYTAGNTPTAWWMPVEVGTVNG